LETARGGGKKVKIRHERMINCQKPRVKEGDKTAADLGRGATTARSVVSRKGKRKEGIVKVRGILVNASTGEEISSRQGGGGPKKGRIAKEKRERALALNRHKMNLKNF